MDNFPAGTTVSCWGWIDTPLDALLVLCAARRGAIPRVAQRLHDFERRRDIRSGAIFVFCEQEAGITRWTDSFEWTPSRSLGPNFLVYAQLGRTASRRPQYENARRSTFSDRSVHGAHWAGVAGVEPDGLIKKTFSTTVSGLRYRVVGYSRPSDVHDGRVRRPSAMPSLARFIGCPEVADYLGPVAEIEIGFRAPACDVPVLSSPALRIDTTPSVSAATWSPVQSETPAMTLSPASSFGEASTMLARRSPKNEPTSAQLGYTTPPPQATHFQDGALHSAYALQRSERECQNGDQAMVALSPLWSDYQPQPQWAARSTQWLSWTDTGLFPGADTKSALSPAGHASATVGQVGLGLELFPPLALNFGGVCDAAGAEFGASMHAAAPCFSFVGTDAFVMDRRE